MNSSPTPSSPIPSPRPKRQRLVLCVTGGLLAFSAQAHEEAQAIPEQAGLRLGAALVLADVNARQALPSQRLQGYLVRGDAGVDRRASALEHAVVEAGWRVDSQWSAYAAVGQHDSDPAHAEAAWLRYELDAPADETRTIQIGRMSPQLGPVMSQAGHMDRFALMPLARRVAVDGDWIDDGVQFGGQREFGDWTGYADIGLWRGQAFPGAEGSSPAPSLHLGTERGDWRGDLFGIALQPDGRGALAQNDRGGHTHNAPDCGTIKTGVLCFSGRTQVMGASLQWQSHAWPVTLQGAYWLRHEDGTLRSVNGQSDHTATYQGGWLQALWRPRADWELGLRSERIQADLSLKGAGATLLAQEAGLSGSAPVRRNTLLLRWQPHPVVTVSAEAGREAQGGQGVNFTVLRAVFTGKS